MNIYANMLVRVKAEAGARKEKFDKVSEGVFAISVLEKPQLNRANARIRALIAAHYKIPPKSVRIVSGHHAKSKLFDVIK